MRPRPCAQLDWDAQKMFADARSPGHAPAEDGRPPGYGHRDSDGVCAHRVGPNGLRYYVADPADRPGGLVEPEGQWMGRLARELGLEDRPVDFETFENVLGAIDPVSGAPLYERPGKRRILAFDVVYSAPKSVSIVHALGEPPVSAEVRRAHEASVRASAEYLERHVTFVQRRRDGDRSVVDSEGLIVAGFLHRTSRAPDPHLHTHLLVANLGRDPSGQWSALDARELLAHIRTATALYQAHLRHEISTAMEMHFSPRRSGVVDLLGARDATIELFSRRSREVADALERFGSDSGRANRLAGDITRPPKQIASPWEELVDQWRDRAGRAGISRAVVNGFGHRSWNVEIDRAACEPDPAEIISRFDRPFSRRELTTALADRTVDGAPVSAIEARVQDALSGSSAHERPRAFYLSDSVGSRIPRSTPEQRWASHQVAVILERVEGAVATARRADRDEELTERPIARGSRVRFTGDLDSLVALGRVASRVHALGGVAVAVAPTPALAGHFAGMSGIRTLSEIDVGAVGDLDVLVVYSAHAIRPAVVKQTLDLHDATGVPLLFVDRYVQRGRSLRTSFAPTVARRQPAEPEIDVPKSTSVTLAADPSGLVSAVRAAGEEWKRKGHGVVVVTAERIADADEIGSPVVRARQAAELARTDHALVAIVIGDGRVLGSSGYRAFGGRRTHVVVEPLDPRSRADLEVSIATPHRGRSLDGPRRERTLGR